MTLLFDLLFGYLVASALVTLVLVRFFRSTEDRVASAGIAEFKSRVIRANSPIERDVVSPDRRVA